jgi:hypothetical protein
MLFQKEGGQFIPQQTSHVFAFRKRHQLILVRLGKHPLKGLTRSEQPPLAKLLPILPTQKWTTFHGIPPKST